MPKDSPTTPPDPLYQRSLSWPLAISMVALLASFAWALYDEFYGRRPYRAYQREFLERYTEHLKRLRVDRAELETAARKLPEIQALEAELSRTREAVRGRLEEIARELSEEVAPRLSALYDVLKNARSLVGSLTYRLETANPEDREPLRAELDETLRKRWVVEAEVNGGRERKEYDYEALDRELTRLRDWKADLQRKSAEHRKPVRVLERRGEQLLRDRILGATAKDVAGLLSVMENFEFGIRQIHVRDVDLVDRCETCHLGIREPVLLTAEMMGGERAFTSHPRPDLLEAHDAERFGCSPCHGGNGVALTSEQAAHGRYKHWLWPLHHPENVEAGCVQCHREDLVLDHASRLEEGKELFRRLGCWGCHRYEGFDRETEALADAREERIELSRMKGKLQRRLKEAALFRRAAEAPDDEATDRERSEFEEAIVASHARTAELTLRMSDVESGEEQLTLRERSLLRERKKIAPSLKEARAKLRREWMPVWLENPHAFRPDTRMPAFRMTEDQRKAVAAYVWQAAVGASLPSHDPGDPARGRELFEARGCLGCHTVDRRLSVVRFDENGEREETREVRPVGNGFAANLTRVGEKARYEYLVRWVHNPRERSYPYCPNENRDIGPKDYEAKGLPFLFDPEHSRCPRCGQELQTQQMTAMPRLQLSWQDSRDIASYLVSLEDPEADYPEAAYLDDPALGKRGETLVRHFGCAGCHEIAGFEEEIRIGTELTNEGSKPIERLDFALLAHDAKRGLLPDGSTNERDGREVSWYDHKGFFEMKLRDPAVFDSGKQKRRPLERLRMPNFRLTPEKVDAITTFLLGSVDSTLPERYFYRPEVRKSDIRQGWWIVKKYNCTGCHEILPGQVPELWGLPRFNDVGFDPDGSPHLGVKDRPPSLVGEGARADPGWLVKFLKNPALSRESRNRNGVRPYVSVRMPHFELSEREIGKLVRFFEALSAQESPYIRPSLEPLEPEELTIAREVFKRSQCIKCHATGDSSTFEKDTIAPSFLLVPERLKPAWSRRWMVDPALLMPGTRMPTGLFVRKGDRWVVSADMSPALSAYEGDHVELFLRYMEQFTPEEEAMVR